MIFCPYATIPFASSLWRRFGCLNTLQDIWSTRILRCFWDICLIIFFTLYSDRNLDMVRGEACKTRLPRFRYSNVYPDLLPFGRIFG